MIESCLLASQSTSPVFVCLSKAFSTEQLNSIMKIVVFIDDTPHSYYESFEKVL